MMLLSRPLVGTLAPLIGTLLFVSDTTIKAMEPPLLDDAKPKITWVSREAKTKKFPSSSSFDGDKLFEKFGNLPSSGAEELMMDDIRFDTSIKDFVKPKIPAPVIGVPSSAECGDVIESYTRLEQDLVCPCDQGLPSTYAGFALAVTSSATLDLNGYTVSCETRPNQEDPSNIIVFVEASSSKDAPKVFSSRPGATVKTATFGVFLASSAADITEAKAIVTDIAIRDVNTGISSRVGGTTIIDVEVQDVVSTGISLRSNYNTVRNAKVSRTGLGCFSVRGTGNTIADSTGDTAGTRIPSDCVVVFSSGAFPTNTLTNNRFSNCLGRGIFFWSQGVISRNHISSTGSVPIIINNVGVPNTSTTVKKNTIFDDKTIGQSILAGGSNFKILGNKISTVFDETIPFEYAPTILVAAPGDSSIIQDNHISDCQFLGIGAQGKFNKILDNVFLDCRPAIAILEAGDFQLIKGNLAINKDTDKEEGDILGYDYLDLTPECGENKWKNNVGSGNQECSAGQKPFVVPTY